MPRDQLKLAAKIGLDDQAGYARRYPEQVAVYDKLGFYDRVLQALQPDEGILVDVGSGTGIFARKAREQFPALKVVGVERSAPMIRLSRKEIESSGLPLQVGMSELLGVNNQTRTAERSYSAKHLTLKESIFRPDNPISIIQDDIRMRQVLTHVLEGRKIQYCTHMFPGSGGDDAAFFNRSEADRQKTPREQAQWDFVLDIRSQALKFATEHTEAGGAFIRVERLMAMNVDEGADAMEAKRASQICARTQQQIGEIFNKMAPYWDEQQSVLIGSFVVDPDNEDHQLLGSVLRHNHPETKSFQEQRFMVEGLKAIRNDRPYIQNQPSKKKKHQ